MGAQATANRAAHALAYSQTQQRLACVLCGGTTGAQAMASYAIFNRTTGAITQPTIVTGLVTGAQKGLASPRYLRNTRQPLTSAEDLSINWTGLQEPSQRLGRRWGEVREFTSRTRGGPRPALLKCSRRVHLWTRLESRGDGRHSQIDENRSGSQKWQHRRFDLASTTRSGLKNRFQRMDENQSATPAGLRPPRDGSRDHQMTRARPLMSSKGTKPHTRESFELSRLSPMAEKVSLRDLVTGP
jgi:hypothetical protein